VLTKTEVNPGNGRELAVKESLKVKVIVFALKHNISFQAALAPEDDGKRVGRAGSCAHKWL
jgi:predicted RNA-binding protein YlqC (UPF0109 family)